MGRASSSTKKPEDAVAYIFRSQPITRQELGEYLIERFGAAKLESLINLQFACVILLRQT